MQSEMVTFVIAFFSVFVALAAIIIWSGVRNVPIHKAWEEKVQSLGFVKVEKAPEVVAQSVASLYRCSSQRFQPDRFMLWDVYEKADTHGGLYVFDLVSTGLRSYVWFGAGMIAVVSPYLNLPYFSVAARRSPAGVANEIFRNIGESFNVFTSEYGSLRRLSLEDYPDLDKLLLIMVENEFATRQFLTDDHLSSLSWLANKEYPMQIECGGDCFALRPLQAPANGHPKANVELLLEGAEKMWSIFAP